MRISLTLLTLIVFTVASFSELSAQIRFGAERFDRAPSSVSGGGVDLGDVNEDGIADLVVAENSSAGMSVFLGDNNGGFSLFDTFNVPIGGALGGPQAAILADFNQDSHLDAVVPVINNFEGNSVVVFSGNGDGTFEVAETLFVELSGSDVIAADVNGDGADDLVVPNADFPNGFLSVYLSVPGGKIEFESPLTTDLTFVNPSAIAAAQLNDDEHIDIIVASDGAGDVVTVLLGDGTGSLNPTAESPFSSDSNGGAVDVEAEDINGDGALDILVSYSFTDELVVRFGDGNGSFSPSTVSPTGLTPGSANGIGEFEVGDFDGDGILDVVGVTINDAMIFLKGNDDGSFTSAISFGTGDFVLNLIATDVNNDGIEDLISFQTGEFTVHIGTGQQDVVTSPTFYFTAPDIDDFVSSDFNGDGIVDLVAASDFGSSISVLTGIGDGSFSEANIINENFQRPFGCEVGDFDEDGSADIVVADFEANSIFLLSNQGNGDFDSPVVVANVNSANRMAVGDVNNDDHLDIVVSEVLTGFVSVILGDGAGGFAAPLRRFAIGEAREIVLVDFDGDNNLDMGVVGTAINNSGAVVLMGNGDGTFGISTQIFEGNVTTGIAAGDANGDGIVDLAIAEFALDVFILPGIGDGTFGLGDRLFGTDNPLDVTFSDLNGDGLDDLIAIDPFEIGMTVYEGSGTDLLDGVQFAVASGIDAGAAEEGLPTAVIAEDVNGDNLPDILVGIRAAEFRGAISVSLNQSNAMVCPLGDINMDGVVDLLDVAPFVDLIISGKFLDKADINMDGVVGLLDVAPFVDLLTGQ